MKRNLNKVFKVDLYPRKPLCKCGKVCFDKKGAQTKRNSLIRKGTVRDLGIYQCRQSTTWHLTKKVEGHRRGRDHVA